MDIWPNPPIKLNELLEFNGLGLDWMKLYGTEN
jgi:hypothetical protein